MSNQIWTLDPQLQLIVVEQVRWSFVHQKSEAALWVSDATRMTKR